MGQTWGSSAPEQLLILCCGCFLSQAMWGYVGCVMISWWICIPQTHPYSKNWMMEEYVGTSIHIIHCVENSNGLLQARNNRHVRDECDFSNASLMACRLPSRSSPSCRCGSIWCSLLAWIEQHRKTGLWFQLLYRKWVLLPTRLRMQSNTWWFQRCAISHPLKIGWWVHFSCVQVSKLKKQAPVDPNFALQQGNSRVLTFMSKLMQNCIFTISLRSQRYVCLSLFVHQVYGAQPHRGTHRSLQGVRIWGPGQIWVRLRCFPWLLFCAKLYSKLRSRALIFRTGSG